MFKNKFFQKNLLLFIAISFNQPLMAAPSGFIFTVDSQPDGTFTIPTYGTGYKFNVDCDNDGGFEAVGESSNYTCDYTGMGGSGIYTIRIEDGIGDGTGFPRVRFDDLGEAKKIIELSNWGTGLWDSMDSTFEEAKGMTVTATDVPNLTNVQNMSNMFHNAVLANPDTSNWDTSNVTSMFAMFDGASVANPDTSSWDTSNVTAMNFMFRYAHMANPDTSSWDISNVSHMQFMFSGMTLPTASYDAILINFNSQSVQSGTLFSGGNSKYCANIAHNNLINADGWTITDGGLDPLCPVPTDGFVMQIDTSISGTSSSTEFEIGTTGTGYNYNVDCDDSNPETNVAFAQTGNYTCSYNSPGIYNIRIDDNVGDQTGFPRVYFHNSGDENKILDLVQWGTGQWSNMELAFNGASNMTVTASDTPDLSQVPSLAAVFSNTNSANPDTSNWNTANVTDMRQMFFNADSANPNTSNWNTANVTTMRQMFSNADSANPDTSSWNTAKVTDMSYMFSGADSANPDTSSWDITQVTTMKYMFNGVTLPTAAYDAILTHFNSQAVQSGIEFSGGNSKYCATVAHNNLVNTDGWIITDGGVNPICSGSNPTDNFVIQVNTSNAGTTSATEFEIPTTGTGYNYNVDCDDNNPLTNTALAQTGNYTCNYASPGIYTIRIEDNVGDGTGFPRVHFYNQGDKDKVIDLIQWGTGQWSSMESAFSGASNMTVTATDTPDLSQVSSLASMFSRATSANPNTSGWDTANVTHMNSMFSGAELANPDTSAWNTGNAMFLTAMFKDAYAANPDTSGWNTSNVRDMNFMFESAHLANPDTSNWNTANVRKMDYMFLGALLANPDTSNWDTAKVRNMAYMFWGADVANPDTSGWDTSLVTDMAYMFFSAEMANPDTSNWDTAKVIGMSYMFRNADSANPDTSHWNTAKVIDMSYMFSGADSANPDASSWDVPQVIDMTGMFSGLTLPTVNYDAMLLNFNSQVVQFGVELNGGNSKYCASAARDNLINTHGWVITDGGLDSSCDDIIFRNSFEVPVDVFNANEKQFTYDFELLNAVKLDSYPELIAVGLDAEQQKVIKFHVRKIAEQMQIRLSDLDQDAFEENTWINQDWQNITNHELTTVTW